MFICVSDALLKRGEFSQNGNSFDSSYLYDNWHVGYFRPDGNFHSVQKVEDRASAFALVARLNGGGKAE